MAVTAVAWLGGCRSDNIPPSSGAADPAVVNLDAVLHDASASNKPVMILIADGEKADDIKAISIFNSTPDIGKDPAHDVTLDIRSSRNRANAARFHPTQTPVLLGISPHGMILSRDIGPITPELVHDRTGKLLRESAEVDARLKELDDAVAANPTDATAQIQLADFLLATTNDREAIPYLEVVAHSDSADLKLRIRAWVALAHAHLWVIEPEKGRHEAKALIAELSWKSPEARAGGMLVLGIQDANAKRFALAREEFNEAIVAAPDSDYSHEASDAVAKLPH